MCFPTTLALLLGKKDSVYFSVSEKGERVSIGYRGPKNELHVSRLKVGRDGKRMYYSNPVVLEAARSYVRVLGHPPTKMDLVEAQTCLGCGGPDFGIPMVQCETCKLWCHAQCATFLLKLPVPTGAGSPWFCKTCDK